MDTKAAFDREEFEAWYCNTKGVDKYWIADRRCEPNSYTLGENVLIYWECWKASRAAIEIYLPQRQSLCASGYGDGYFVPSDSGEGLEYDEVVEAITSHGIRIKGKAE